MTAINYSSLVTNEVAAHLAIDSFTVELKLLTRVVQVAFPCATSGATDRIKSFVNEHIEAFSRVCNARFPFDLLHHSTATTLLKYSLENSTSLLAHLMLTTDYSLTEKELSFRFDTIYERLQTREIGFACCDLVNYGDNKSLYCLLWLLKRTLGADFVLPMPIDLKKIKETLSIAIDWERVPACLMKMFYLPVMGDDPLYTFLLEKERHDQFVACTIDSFKLELNPSTLIDFLKISPIEHKRLLADALVESKDKISTHVVGIFKEPSLKLVHEHFIQLLQLLPKVKFETLFERPFLQFPETAACVKWMPFSSSHSVFCHETLLIGVYKKWIVAVDTTTQKPVWDFALKEGCEYDLEQVGDRISVKYKLENKACYLQASSGVIQSKISLSLPQHDQYGWIHSTASGTVYQLVDGKLAINSVEVSDDLRGALLPLSTHVGLQMWGETSLTVVSPTGKIVEIPNVIQAVARGDTLYLIEPYRLTTRILTNDGVSEIQKSIPLEGDHTHSLLAVSENTVTVICEKKFKKFPIFINLETERAVYSPQEVNFASTRCLMERGFVWTLHEGKILKVSSDQTTEVVELKGDQNKIIFFQVLGDVLYFGTY